MRFERAARRLGWVSLFIFGLSFSCSVDTATIWLDILTRFVLPPLLGGFGGIQILKLEERREELAAMPQPIAEELQAALAGADNDYQRAVIKLYPESIVGA